MTPENWKRLRPEFNAALDLPTSERAHYVAELMARDQQLGVQLASLLRAHVQTQSTWSDPSSHADEIPIFSPGEVILDRFQIVRLLGSGGMGDVYETNDWETERIALKAIRQDLVQNREVFLQFRNEVRLARRVGGPHICRIHELFLVPAAGRRPLTAFLTMEFLEGVTLADRLKKSYLPWQEAEDIALQICQGLNAVHAAGLIHRDLKTRNIMLSARNGKAMAVLMDFGLAHENLPGQIKQHAQGHHEPEPSSVDPCLIPDIPGPGTPQYMAPEQWEGRELTPATDIYALGLILYELVTGRHPFEGHSLIQTALRRAKPRQKPSSIQPGLPHRWDSVIDRCLSYDPVERFQSAFDVAEVLKTRPPLRRVLNRFTKIILAHPVLFGSVALLAGAGLVSGLWYYKHYFFQPSADAQLWYDRGMTALDEGSYYKAAKAFEKARDEDGQFALARARLADTWNQLEYEGQAREEIGAIEPSSEDRLHEVDKQYVEAVRASLNDRGHRRAVTFFGAMLNKLPVGLRSYAYVDLGSEYERAGEIARARSAYEESIRRAPQSPLAYLRLGRLLTRQIDDKAAEATLARALSLYQTLANAEGLATVAYLRGELASNIGQLPKAHDFFKASLASASTIPNIPLEAQAMTAISGIEEGQKAVKDAEQALRFAHDHNLPYWEAEGLIRKGNGFATLEKPDIAAAEDCLTRSLYIAEDKDWPGIVGLAQISLAALRDSEGKPDRQSSEAATTYFRKVGYTEYTIQALTLLARAQASDSDFSGSLQTAKDLLKLSSHFRNEVSLAQAEEVTGQAYENLEQYPKALEHFKAAVQIAHESGDKGVTSFEISHLAEVMAKLGKYPEATNALNSILRSKDSQLMDEIARTSCQMMVSQTRYREAIALSRRILSEHRQIDPQIADVIRLEGALACANLGAFEQARRLCREATDSAQKRNDAAALAAAMRSEAVIDLRANLPRNALQMAKKALEFSTLKDQKESAWFCWSAVAEAQADLGDTAAALRSANQAKTVFAQLKSSWDAECLARYVKRRDIAENEERLDKTILKATRR